MDTPAPLRVNEAGWLIWNAVRLVGIGDEAMGGPCPTDAEGFACALYCGRDEDFVGLWRGEVGMSKGAAKAEGRPRYWRAGAWSTL